MNIEKITHIGERPDNQDSIMAYSDEKLGIFAAAVADGVGSFDDSSVCSKFITAYLEKFFDENKSEICSMEFADLEPFLYSKVKELHDTLIYIAKEKNISYGSTLTLFLLIENTYFVVQVGDSRCYIYQDGALRQITKDQTLSDNKSVLLQAMGHSQIEPMLYDGIIGDKFMVLICSDGLTNEISQVDIQSVLKMDIASSEKLEILLDMAKNAGERDNISAVLINS